MGVTTTDSADKSGVLDASLENAAGNFVAPDTAGLLAGEAAMQPSGVPGVLEPDFTSTSPGAYPLSMLTYAAVPLGTISKSQCGDYLALLDYAAGSGQTPGNTLGDLPPGYAPLPSQLTGQTQSVASEVAACPQDSRPGTSPANNGNPSGTNSPSGGGTGPGSTPGSSGTPGTPGPTGAGKPGSDASTPAAVPSGGPANVSQGIELAGGITPANPSVFGYALPVGVITGALASLAAPLISRRRALRLLQALRLPQLPGPPRSLRPLRSLSSLRPSRLRGPWRGAP
jgi:hypothetical protein